MRNKQGENTIFALATQTEPKENTVWAFSDPKEYTKALRLLRHHAVPYISYHGVDRQNKPFNITAFHLSDAKWEALSGGLNDAGEIENWINERVLR
jgi:hypothetical protein